MEQIIPTNENITVADVLNMFAETDRRFKETARQFAETDKRFKETDKKFEETDKKFKETDRQFKESDRKFEQTIHELKEMFAKTDKQLKRTDKKINALTSRWGDFVESLVAPSVEKMFKKRGIEITSVHQHVRIRKNGKETEIDILGINGEYAVVIEAKSRLSVDDVNEHIKRLQNFKFFFPEYKDRKVIGAVAGIKIDTGADRYAYKKGLFVIAQSGETVKILNNKNFMPEYWG